MYSLPITSRSRAMERRCGTRRRHPLSNEDFDTGSLRRDSYARPGKLFTANRDLLVAQVDKLKEEPYRRIIAAVVSLLQADPTK